MQREEEPPDVLLIGAEWPARALLRAQLIEEGFTTVGADAWPPPREFLQREARPRLVIIDLRGLESPDVVLREVRALFGAEHVMVIASAGTLPADSLRQLGVEVVDRPATVSHIVDRTRALLWRRA